MSGDDSLETVRAHLEEWVLGCNLTPPELVRKLKEIGEDSLWEAVELDEASKRAYAVAQMCAEVAEAVAEQYVVDNFYLD